MSFLVFWACTQVHGRGPRHQGGSRVAQRARTCPEVSGCPELAASLRETLDRLCATSIVGTTTTTVDKVSMSLVGGLASSTGASCDDD